MPSLTFIHLACHPSLAVLPSFDGLMGLKSLTLAVLLSLTELPSFEHLDSLERLQLSSMTSLTRLPDLPPVSTTLKSFVVSDRGTGAAMAFWARATCRILFVVYTQYLRRQQRRVWRIILLHQVLLL